MGDEDLASKIVDHYRTIVEAAHPAELGVWPILSGYNVKYVEYQGWAIIILIATGNSVMKTTEGLGEAPANLFGQNGRLDPSTLPAARERVERHYRVSASDAVLFRDPSGTVSADEFRLMLQKHETVMGMGPMKIFLSHKGADKPLVRNFKQTLELLGFDPWLDEDAMPAGTNLERGILQGFRDSCAAVFFITPNYVDENFLATEVDYAIAEQRRKGSKFQIITLVIDGGSKTNVPDLLHQYVWKEPQTQLEALREIIKSLPVRVGAVYWKDP